MKRILSLVACLLAAQAVFAATNPTTVSDNIRLANGQEASGQITISWPSFVEPDGTVISSSSSTVTLRAGSFTTHLMPTVGATPSSGGNAEVYYTVQYLLFGGGPGLQERWSVPPTSATLTIASILVVIPAELQGPSGSTLPATCKVGDFFMVNGVQNVCVSKNTWSALDTLSHSAGVFVAAPVGDGIPFITGPAQTRITNSADITGLIGFVPLAPGNNLSEVNPATARQNLGLGSAALDAENKFLLATTLGTTVAALDGSGKLSVGVLPSLNIGMLGLSGTPSAHNYLNGSNGWQVIPYSDITGTPTIPTNNNQLSNGAGYAVASTLSTVASTGHYSDLIGLPTLGSIATHAATDYLSSSAPGSTVATLVSGTVPLSQIPTIPTTQISGLGTAAAQASTAFVASSLVGANSGIATLDSSGKLTSGQIPAISYNTLTNRPAIPTELSQLTNDAGFLTASGLAPVAVSGRYSDLTGTPALNFDASGAATAAQAASLQKSSNLSDLASPSVARTNLGLAVVASTGLYSSLTGAPTLASVATSGSYNDLLNKPTIPSAFTLPVATGSILGGVKAGANIAVAGDGTISVAAPYSLPVATSGVVGGVSVGSHLAVTGQGLLSVVASDFDLAGTAATAAAGTLRATNNLSDLGSATVAKTNLGLSTVASTGSYADLSNKPTIPSAYTLPAATGSVLGGVKAGANLTIAGDGTLSAAAPYTLPSATTGVLGGIIVGTNLNVASGVVSVNASAFDAAGAATAAAAGSLKTANNLSDVVSPSTARTNLGLATVAHSGSYTDLTSLPLYGNIVSHNAADFLASSLLGANSGAAQLDSTGKLLTSELPTLNTGNISGLGTAATHNAGDFILSTTFGVASGVATLDVNSKLTASQLPSIAYSSISGTPTLATVATTGAYSSLTGTPSSLPPTGGASGDLGSNFPSPTVVGINGIKLTSLGAGILAINSSGVPSLATTGAVQAALGYTGLNAALNLSDIANPATARNNLGLGSMAQQSSAGYLPIIPAVGGNASVGLVYQTSTGITRQALNTDISGLLGFVPVNGSVLGAASGIATLDGSSKLTASQLPAVPWTDVTGAPTFLASSAIGTTVAPLVSGQVPTMYLPTAPLATTSTAGQIIVGTNLAVASGVLSVNASAFDAAGTAAGIAAGSLRVTNNLSDLGSAAAARSNLGLAAVATTGAYNSLSGTPSLASVATSGHYSDLSGLPTIPTTTSQLTNDSGFISSSSLPVATTTSLGQIIVQNYLTVDGSGKLSVNVGQSVNQVAAGNDPRITGAVQQTALGTANGPAILDTNSKLETSELPTIGVGSISGLGTAALQNTGFFLLASQLGTASGVATLDGSVHVPLSQLPTIPATQISGLSAFTLAAATTSVLGGVIVGGGLAVSGGGTVSVSFGTSAGQALQGSLFGAASGVATLDGAGHLTSSQLPTGAYATIDVNGKVLTSELPAIGADQIGGGTVTDTAFGYLANVTSDVQAQINAVSSGGSNLSISNTISGLSILEYPAKTDPALNSFLAGLHYSASQRVNIVLIGDSVTRCWQSQSGCGVGPAVESSRYPRQLQIALQAQFGNGGTGIIPIMAGTGGIDSPEWTLAGTVTTNSGIGPTESVNAASSLYQLSSGATATFAANTYDTLYVYCAEASNSAGITVTIDGTNEGTACGSTAGSFTAMRQGFSAPGGLGTHTAVLTATGNFSYIYGAEGSIGTTGVVVHDVAIGGALSEMFNSSQKLAFLQQLFAGGGGIHLFINLLGGNDAIYNGTGGVSGFRTNLQNIINWEMGLYTVSPSILIEGFHNISPSGNSTVIQGYQAASQAIAVSNNLAYMGWADRLGSLAQMQALATINGDNVHLSDRGQREIGGMLLGRIVDFPAAGGGGSGLPSNITVNGDNGLAVLTSGTGLNAIASSSGVVGQIALTDDTGQSFHIGIGGSTNPFVGVDDFFITDGTNGFAPVYIFNTTDSMVIGGNYFGFNSSTGNTRLAPSDPGIPLAIENANTLATNIGIYNLSSGGHKWNLGSLGSGLGGVGEFALSDLTATTTPLTLNGTGALALSGTTPELSLTNSSASAFSQIDLVSTAQGWHVGVGGPSQSLVVPGALFVNDSSLGKLPVFVFPTTNDVLIAAGTYSVGGGQPSDPFNALTVETNDGTATVLGVWNTSSSGHLWNLAAMGTGTFTFNDITSSTQPLALSGQGALTLSGSSAGIIIGSSTGFTGTKTAGSCVLTITGGIITNVSGC